MKRHQPEKSGEWSCESGLCQHLSQMREMPPIHPAPLQGSAGLPATVVPGVDYIRDGGGRLGCEGADETAEEV